MINWENKVTTRRSLKVKGPNLKTTKNARKKEKGRQPARNGLLVTSSTRRGPINEKKPRANRAHHLQLIFFPH